MSSSFAVLSALIVSGAVLGCLPEGEVLRVTVSAYADDPDRPAPRRGAWGDELKPGSKVIAVSHDLVERGLVRGVRVRLEGFAGSYRVMDRLAAPAEREVRVYLGTDLDALARWQPRELEIYWEEL